MQGTPCQGAPCYNAAAIPLRGDAVAAEIIDGKEMASQVRTEVAEGVRRLLADSGIRPGLAAVLVGEDPASAVYVRNKIRACQEVDILTETFHLEATVPESQVIALVHDLNADSRFHGILVQLPLPAAITERHVIVAIDPDKDVDGLHPLNGGLLLQGQPRFVPATPAGIQQMLLRSGNDPAGKHVVVCGRSNIVGKPLAALLLPKAPGATHLARRQVGSADTSLPRRARQLHPRCRHRRCQQRRDARRGADTRRPPRSAWLRRD